MKSRAFVLGLWLVGSVAFAQTDPTAEPRAIEARRAWVVLHDGTRDPAALARELRRLGVDVPFVPRLVPALGVFGTDAEAASLARHPNVRRVEADVAGGGGLREAVPLSGFGPTQASGFDGGGLVVAVLDSGFDATHPDLADALVGEACFCPGCCPDGSSERHGVGASRDEHGHGSFVAGVLTSDGTVAAPGAIPAVDIVAVRVLDASNRFASMMQIVSGLDWLATDGPSVDVVNLSLGTDQLFESACGDGAAWEIAVRTAVDNLVARGITVVAASLNAGSSTGISAPACLPNVIAVGATVDAGPNRGTIAAFSNQNALVDLVAPGALITSVALGGGTTSMTGTSFSSPLVAACAALVHGEDATRTPADVRAVLRDSGRTVLDSRNGLTFSVLDCGAVLRTDLDRDGVYDDVDNCPEVANPDQADVDRDGEGNACSACGDVGDTDGDDRCDDVDVCPAVADDGTDSDMDGRGDACDPCAFDPDDDVDGDGLCADVDNCPEVANPDQADANGDGRGDACKKKGGCGCDAGASGAWLVWPALLWLTRRRRGGGRIPS
ncbi:MAG: S8 family serine peptidase [Sandaracinus sp.]|nr:S8 family serine peptidase [Sandaracinus sp.]MCB9632807.1 S8 family serine peptidase [Sandaracinus sp.]